VRTKLPLICSTVALVLALVTSCDPNGSGYNKAGPTENITRKPSPGTSDSSCHVAKSRAQDLLPEPTITDINTISKNDFCIPLTRLAGEVLGRIDSGRKRIATTEFSDAERKVLKRNLTTLTDHVGRLAGPVLTANKIAECAYETGNLATAIYQQQDHPWSVAAVVILRTNVDAAADVGKCYFKDFIPTFPPSAPGAAAPGPKFGVFGGVSVLNRPSGRFIVLTASDSDVMCDFLAATFPSGCSRQL
jgi:hypothetical protein